MIVFFALAVLSASTSLPAQPPAPAMEESKPIIVTARSMKDARRALDECIARKCPTLEDIKASLDYAEIAFVAGDYNAARSALKYSIGRNRDAAPQYPHAVAGLYRANARVSIHLGESEDYRDSTWGAVRSLRKGLPKSNIDVIAAQLDVGDMYARTGNRESADHAYRLVADQAQKAGHKELAATATLRSAWLEYQTGKADEALKQIEAIAASNDPQMRLSRLTAMVLLARLDRDQGSTASSERLIAELKTAGLEKPVLLWAPDIKIPLATDGTASESDGLSSTTLLMMTPTDYFEKTWADIGFWVRPDGHVEDPEVLRSNGDPAWIKPVLSSVGGRIYAPMKSTDGSYRIERFTYTSLMALRTDSRIRQRSAQGRIEYLDLTTDEPSGKSRSN